MAGKFSSASCLNERNTARIQHWLSQWHTQQLVLQRTVKQALRIRRPGFGRRSAAWGYSSFNPDGVACGQDEPTDFNSYAKAAAFWTRNALRPDTNAYLQNLPLGPLEIGKGAQLVHGAITHEDDYIMSESFAADNFAIDEFDLAFFGHSHFQVVFTCDSSGNVILVRLEVSDEAAVLLLDGDKKYLVNPGSVGQPRDGDPRAGFAIWDPDHARVEFIQRLDRLSQSAGVRLPKGAGRIVDTAARELVRQQGSDALKRYAKCHFKNTTRVLQTTLVG